MNSRVLHLSVNSALHHHYNFIFGTLTDDKFKVLLSQGYTKWKEGVRWAECSHTIQANLTIFLLISPVHTRSKVSRTMQWKMKERKRKGEEIKSQLWCFDLVGRQSWPVRSIRQSNPPSSFSLSKRSRRHGMNLFLFCRAQLSQCIYTFLPELQTNIRQIIYMYTPIILVYLVKQFERKFYWRFCGRSKRITIQDDPRMKVTPFTLITSQNDCYCYVLKSPIS